MNSIFFVLMHEYRHVSITIPLPALTQSRYLFCLREQEVVARTKQRWLNKVRGDGSKVESSNEEQTKVAPAEMAPTKEGRVC